MKFFLYSYLLIGNNRNRKKEVEVSKLSDLWYATVRWCLSFHQINSSLSLPDVFQSVFAWILVHFDHVSQIIWSLTFFQRLRYPELATGCSIDEDREYPSFFQSRLSSYNLRNYFLLFLFIIKLIKMFSFAEGEISFYWGKCYQK